MHRHPLRRALGEHLPSRHGNQFVSFAQPDGCCSPRHWPLSTEQPAWATRSWAAPCAFAVAYGIGGVRLQLFAETGIRLAVWAVVALLFDVIGRVLPSGRGGVGASQDRTTHAVWVSGLHGGRSGVDCSACEEGFPLTVSGHRAFHLAGRIIWTARLHETAPWYIDGQVQYRDDQGPATGVSDHECLAYSMTPAARRRTANCSRPTWKLRLEIVRPVLLRICCCPATRRIGSHISRRSPYPIVSAVGIYRAHRSAQTAGLPEPASRRICLMEQEARRVGCTAAPPTGAVEYHDAGGIWLDCLELALPLAGCMRMCDVFRVAYRSQLTAGL